MAELPPLAELEGLAEEPNGTGPGLPTPRVRVTMDDGRVLVTQLRNPDYLRWDRTAAKHNWPPAEKAKFLFLTFTAWSALRREGQIHDSMTWEEFSEQRAVHIGGADTDDVAHPTPPGPGPG